MVGGLVGWYQLMVCGLVDWYQLMGGGLVDWYWLMVCVVWLAGIGRWWVVLVAGVI